MKNIETILNESGVELTAEQKQAIATAVTDNYKTIAEFEKTKEKLTTAQADLKKADENLATLTGELDTLKQNGASVEEWQSKYETLVKQQEAEKAEREEAEKAKQLDSEFAERFNAITAEKKFANDYTKNGIMSEWRKAIESGEHKGKGDADVFTALTKDTEGLYVGVQKEVLKGGSPIGGTNINKEDFAKMGYMARVNLKNDNPTLYKNLTEE